MEHQLPQLPQLYNEVKTKVVIPKLEQAAHFPLMTDLWTNNSNSPFMSFTIHSIDSDWCLQSLYLDIVPLYNDHTGHNIAEAFQDVLANWNISTSRITSSTTDNGSNFVAAFQIDRVQRCVRKCHSLIEVFVIYDRSRNS